jgi:hypothetical protein
LISIAAPINAEQRCGCRAIQPCHSVRLFARKIGAVGVTQRRCAHRRDPRTLCAELTPSRALARGSVVAT